MAGKGGAWKVAYADFVTAMMAFFLVMWITGQSKPVKQEVARYFEDPHGVKKGKTSTTTHGEKDAVIHGAQEIGRGEAKGLAMAEERNSKNPIPRGVDAKAPPKMILFHDFRRTCSLGNPLQFGPNSTEIDAEAERRLRGFVAEVRGKPHKVEIAPLFSEQDYSTYYRLRSARKLGFARSIATRDYLIAAGIERQRIQLCFPADDERNSSDFPLGWRQATNEGNLVLFATDVQME